MCLFIAVVPPLPPQKQPRLISLTIVTRQSRFHDYWKWNTRNTRKRVEKIQLFSFFSFLWIEIYILFDLIRSFNFSRKRKEKKRDSNFERERANSKFDPIFNRLLRENKNIDGKLIFPEIILFVLLIIFYLKSSRTIKSYWIISIFLILSIAALILKWINNYLNWIF